MAEIRKEQKVMTMTELINAISVVGFPIVMCGILCYYIFKVQSELITSINKNTTAMAKLITTVTQKLEAKEESK